MADRPSDKWEYSPLDWDELIESFFAEDRAREAARDHEHWYTEVYMPWVRDRVLREINEALNGD